MKTIIGQAATDHFFYKRDKLILNLWEKLKKGQNVLISAPRRIGKTSVMLYMKQNPIKGYQVIYLIIESVNNKNEFFRKLVHEIYAKLNNGNKFTSIMRKLRKSTLIKSIGPDGIAFEKKDIDYYLELKNIISQLDLKDEKLLIMIDEFAQTVENIMQDENDSNAINFLESNRDIRINPEISKKIQFIYAGSIGLENIVSHLNSISAINDLLPFPVNPFTEEDAKDYILNYALQETRFQFQKEQIDYFLKKIEWLNPYFINILLDEIEDICKEQNQNNITEKIIDEAFLHALQKRIYFEHWHTRLRKAYKKESYNFSKEVLNLASTNTSLNINEILNIAVGLGIADNYKDILNSLVYDGYINNIDDVKEYHFNSPLLKMWWNNNVAN